MHNIRLQHLLFPAFLVCFLILSNASSQAQIGQFHFQVDTESSQLGAMDVDPKTPCEGDVSITVRGEVEVDCGLSDEQVESRYYARALTESERIARIRGNRICGLLGGDCDRNACVAESVAFVSDSRFEVVRTDTDGDDEPDRCILYIAFVWRATCGCGTAED